LASPDPIPWSSQILTPTHGLRLDRRGRAGPEPGGCTMKGSELLTIRAESRNGVTIVTLGGELDLATASTLLENLFTLGQDGSSTIMLDLRELTFLDSSGLQAFIRARSDAEANGHRVLLIGAEARVRRLFEVTNTLDMLDDGDAVGVLDRFTGSRGDGDRRLDPE
jgi:anti-sigma B factor antagonist